MSENDCKCLRWVNLRQGLLHVYRAPVAQLVEHRAVTWEVVSLTLAEPSLRLLKHYSKRIGSEVPGVVAVLCVVDTEPMLIAVSITEMVILYKYVTIIVIYVPVHFNIREQNT